MGVLGDLPDQRVTIGLGHPVLGLDLLFGIDPRLEVRAARGVLGGERDRLLALTVERLGVHENGPACFANVTQDYHERRYFCVTILACTHPPLARFPAR